MKKGVVVIADGHSLEGMRIRCGDKFAIVLEGVCMECKQKVIL